MVKIKRSEIATFIDIDPGNEDYQLLGEGVIDGKINYNPKTSEETYISEDTAHIAVESYAPTMPIEMTCVTGDPCFEFIDNLRKTQAVLGDAETTIVNVWMYETGGPAAYPAEQREVSIQIDDFGGPGGESGKINFTINFTDDPVTGTFDSGDSSFT